MFNKVMLFIEVVKAGSFTKAATNCRVSKSQLSRTITTLEKELNVKLLLRSTRTLTLTQEGEYLYHQCKEICNKFSAIRDNLKTEQNNLKGTIKITAPITLGVELLVNRFSDFQKKHPEIRLVLDFNAKLRNIIAEGYDLGIRAGQNLQDSSLYAKCILKYQSVICAAPSYLEKFGAPKTPEDLLQHRCITGITYREDLPKHKWLFYIEGKEKKYIVNSVCEVNNFKIHADMAIAGGCIARIPDISIQNALLSGKLKKILIDYQMPPASIYVLYHEKAQMPERVRLLIQFLSDIKKQ